MRPRSILAPFALLLFLALLAPAVAHAAPAAPATPAPQTAVAAPAAPAPALGDFLASLAQPAPQPAAASCGTSFCTQAERDACNQQCLKHGHTVFVGLECCSSTCTTLCICGSRPIDC